MCLVVESYGCYIMYQKVHLSLIHISFKTVTLINLNLFFLLYEANSTALMTRDPQGQILDTPLIYFNGGP